MSRTNVRFALCLTLICSIAAAVPASAQHFQQMNGSLTQIAAGRNEVWGLNGSEVYRFNATTQMFSEIKIKAYGAVTQIAVGSGTLLQKDEVWAVSFGGAAYRYDFSTNKFVLENGPCTYACSPALVQIAVGPGYEDNCHPYEVWGNGNGFPFRYNYCTTQFEYIPVSYDGNNFAISQIATGGGAVIGISQSTIGSGSSAILPGSVWAYCPAGYVSVYCQTAPEAYWVWLTAVTTGFLPPPFSQVSVGPLGQVWGIGNYYVGVGYDSDLFAFYSDGGYAGFATSDGGEMCTLQVAVGGDGLWAIQFPANGSFPQNDYPCSTPAGVQIEGAPPGFAIPFTSQVQSIETVPLGAFPGLSSTPGQIAVGSGAGVWALDNQNRVYTLVP